jgi:hypothetical protein
LRRVFRIFLIQVLNERILSLIPGFWFNSTFLSASEAMKRGSVAPCLI